MLGLCVEQAFCSDPFGSLFTDLRKTPKEKKNLEKSFVIFSMEFAGQKRVSNSY